jgi:hypothetical protein
MPATAGRAATHIYCFAYHYTALQPCPGPPSSLLQLLLTATSILTRLRLKLLLCVLLHCSTAVSDASLLLAAAAVHSYAHPNTTAAHYYYCVCYCTALQPCPVPPSSLLQLLLTTTSIPTRLRLLQNRCLTRSQDVARTRQRQPSWKLVADALVKPPPALSDRC